MFEAEFWVAVSFLLFLGVLAYFGVHTRIAAALDERSARIKAELDEAQRLRAEAEALLAAYQAKQRDAERQAAEIIAAAQTEAEAAAAEARGRMEDFVARRTRLAETKIAQAEAQAMADVRAAAAEAAVAAAERILMQAARGDVAQSLIARGIAEVKTKLN